MFAEFKAHIKLNFPNLFKDRILLACSSGIDSMVMTHLCQKLNLNITLAHCNFCLRGHESNLDEAFVVDYASKQDILVFSKQFDTQSFVDNSKYSIQMAARELRYNWFQSLSEQHQFSCVLTAHHADDNLETFLINLSRGSGLDGLVGIPEKNGLFLRPLLPFSRDQILQYAQKHQIEWREDSSNVSLKYQRNQLRHKLVTVLKEIYPNILESLTKTQSHLEASKELLESHIQDIEEQVIVKTNLGEIHFDINALKALKSLPLYLFPLFNKYGFSDWKALSKLLDGQSGKKLLSKTHTLIKNRQVLILFSNDLPTATSQKIESHNDIAFIENLGCHLKIDKVSVLDSPDTNTIYVDFDKLQFPLELRPWKNGDYFYPKGMEGKKKISKFFKDEKMSLSEKDKTLLLCSDAQVVWVVGKRQDARFIASKTDALMCKISLQYATD
ncbi:MAG: tRNA lysidine(34) synthetase TilS [Flavobacteriaceae bacterium]|nr:tRNA lysidine(34) synthetase TilS [Flavobacteriaceae bacterium]